MNRPYQPIDADPPPVVMCRSTAELGTVGYRRMSDRGTRPGAVVFTHSDPTLPVVHVLDGVVADYERGREPHHTDATESLSHAVFAAVQAWEVEHAGEHTTLLDKT